MHKVKYIVLGEPDYFDWELYYSEEDAKDSKLCIMGNDFTLNKELYANTRELLEQLDDELSQLSSDESVTLANVDVEVLDLVTDQVRMYDSKLSLSDTQKYELANLAYQLYNVSQKSDIDDENIRDALTILEGTQYAISTIKGNSQGEYAIVFYPEANYTKEQLDYVEAVVFGSGYEWHVTETEIDVDSYNNKADLFAAITNALEDSWTVYLPYMPESALSNYFHNSLGVTGELVFIDQDYNNFF